MRSGTSVPGKQAEWINDWIDRWGIRKRSSRRKKRLMASKAGGVASDKVMLKATWSSYPAIRSIKVSKGDYTRNGLVVCIVAASHVRDGGTCRRIPPLLSSSGNRVQCSNEVHVLSHTCSKHRTIE